MKVLPFTADHSSFRIGLIIKEAAMEEPQLIAHYVRPLELAGIKSNQIVTIGAKYNDNNKMPAKEGRAHAHKILNVCNSLKLETLLVADNSYYKFLTGIVKTTNKIGAVEKCSHKGFEHINILLSINYQALFYNDSLKFKLDESLKALLNFENLAQTKIGTDIIKTGVYPKTIPAVRDALNWLHRYGAITCDIETFGLRFNTAGIGTIAFAVDKHSGVAFDVSHTNKRDTQTIYRMLREFFGSYLGQIVFHNALFDVKVLVYELFMDNPLDYIGMAEGLEIFQKSHCTMVLTYIAVNSTAGNKLGLKENSLEYTGDYAEDEIKDIRKIKLKPLLKYNLIDCLATWYLIDKYDVVLNDPELRSFYKTIGQPSLIPTIKMMLIGLPLDMDEVDILEMKLQTIRDGAHLLLRHHPLVIKAVKIINQLACDAANVKLKKLVKTVDQFNVEFNPGSDNHVRILLHDLMQLPINYRTKTKLASTKAKVLERHLNLVTNKTDRAAIKALIELSSVDIILNNFIKNFKLLAFYKIRNQPWLNGNLKTTGTQGLRYSSTDPNMQNMPSTSTWAKEVKACFRAPPGFVIGSADFSSLEDRINAILTKDPNKIKVYTDGFDGHCLRAYAYFRGDMSGIDNSVGSINSIKSKYPGLRQKSKVPTFALTYEGTWYTLVKNLGLSRSEAQRIEQEYHALYTVSDKFSAANIAEAGKTGYVKLAFGAKLRTPILQKVVLGSKKTPYEAEAEGRSANNAITQSWGVLTNRAVIEFEKRLANMPAYISYVLICNVIHDAIYILIKKDPIIIKWVNDNLIECMEWNDHPAIKNNDVPMEAELEIGLNLAKQVTVPNSASKKQIEDILNGKIFA